METWHNFLIFKEITLSLSVVSVLSGRCFIDDDKS